MHLRVPRVPGTFRERNELHDAAVTPHQNVRRDFEALDRLEIGMSVPVQAVAKQSFYGLPPELAGWEADAVQHDEARLDAGRA